MYYIHVYKQRKAKVLKMLDVHRTGQKDCNWSGDKVHFIHK